MLDFKQIESFYPENLRVFKRNLMREYLQYKILSIIYDSPYGQKLAFMGGTALRIAYEHSRFSEDLDFDNLGIDRDEFENMTILIKNKLEKEGYAIEIKNVFLGAYHCYIRIKDVLYDLGMSGHKEEKLLIQIDTEPQKFKYKPEQIVLNKFDVFLRINMVPANILLSQKIYAIFHRKRSMGRDFYDTVFLLGRGKPDFRYLREKMDIEDIPELKKRLLEKCKDLNFKVLAKDIEPFLLSAGDAKKVLLFRDYIRSLAQ